MGITWTEDMDAAMTDSVRRAFEMKKSVSVMPGYYAFWEGACDLLESETGVFVSPTAIRSRLRDLGYSASMTGDGLQEAMPRGPRGPNNKTRGKASEFSSIVNVAVTSSTMQPILDRLDRIEAILKDFAS